MGQKGYLVFLIILLLISGCSTNTTPPVSSETQAVEPTNQPQSTPTEPIYPLGERFKIKEYTLNTPSDWYYTIVNEKNLVGWVFTPEDPLLTAEKGFDGWAGLMWLVTPLPEGTDAQALRENMINQIPAYGQSDLEALLVVTERAGVFDLGDNTAVVFTIAEMDVWSGIPALRMDGVIQIHGESEVSLDTSIYLMWNDEEFLSFYQFSDQRLTAELVDAFTASRESLLLTE